jgi:NADP-dependent 3-hydroxy acid dehydrogenase YdfG
MPPERKIAIITGCSSGIGLATTKLFLSSEITVFGIDISPFPDSTLPANFHFHQTDLLKPKASFDAVGKVDFPTRLLFSPTRACA